ncbi:MAG: molybdopterin biosynthesis protein [Desulfobacteraceae bacterium]|nr:molybdopterin biosynthesis protein [Desulfobacteraceae bacterium]
MKPKQRHKRNVFLEMRSIEEAGKIMFDAFPCRDTIESEVVPATEAVGRVLASPVSAVVSSPNFHSAAMDGIAVKAETTFGAKPGHPKTLVAGEDAVYVNTGHVLPGGTDAVIMIEHVNEVDDRRLQIESPVFPWQHVRKMGEDIVATQLLYPRNHVVTPYCIGALLSAGIYEVSVRKRPKVLIIPTGSELVDWRRTSPAELKPGQVIETNSYVLGCLAEACGAVCNRQEMVMDDLDHIKQTVLVAATGDVDLIMTIGGSSAGSEDFAKPVISQLGRVLVHGVTMMPGKPLIIGEIEKKPVFGIPGYPVSAILAFEQFVQPLLYRMQGRPAPERQKVHVRPTRKIASKLGLEEFVRVKLGQVGGQIVATPLPRAAGCITSITEADGIIRIPNHHEGLKPGDTVEAELLAGREQLNNTIVVVGSHDNTLDVLADELRAHSSGVTLSSSHVGSMGGLMAVKKGVCHMAGTHLLDVTDGSYNISYIKKFLPEVPVKLVHLVMREQGLIVPKGNPRGVTGIEDLAGGDIRFINRQGGSGTRILLDYRLEQLQIKPEQVAGYHTEEFTHMAVAVAVQSGAVDAGLGIAAAAMALGLDFVPVVTEQYDIIIPDIYYDSHFISILLDTINSVSFKQRVNRLGGYDTRRTGDIIDV